LKTLATNEIKIQKTNTEFEAQVIAPAYSYEYEKDVLSQFKANMAQVEELNQRLRFVLAEVNHLIQKKS